MNPQDSLNYFEQIQWIAWAKANMSSLTKSEEVRYWVFLRKEGRNDSRTLVVVDNNLKFQPKIQDDLNLPQLNDISEDAKLEMQKMRYRILAPNNYDKLLSEKYKQKKQTEKMESSQKRIDLLSAIIIYPVLLYGVISFVIFIFELIGKLLQAPTGGFLIGIGGTFIYAIYQKWLTMNLSWKLIRNLLLVTFMALLAGAFLALAMEYKGIPDCENMPARYC